MQLITTEAAVPLAEKVAAVLKAPRPQILRTHVFDNGQMEIRGFIGSIANDDVVLFQVFPDQVHDRLFELLLALDLLQAHGPRHITGVLPYLPYSRSDRPGTRGGRVPVRLIASLLEQAGLTRLVTTELHTHGPDPRDQFRLAAGYVDRILKGERPGDLPVQDPTRLTTALNMKTAKALGLTVPATLLALRARPPSAC
jgi:phosphoribosylpyrophosphate synthetase